MLGAPVSAVNAVTVRRVRAAREKKLTMVEASTSISACGVRECLEPALGRRCDDLGSSGLRGSEDGRRDQLVPGRLRGRAGRPLLSERSSGAVQTALRAAARGAVLSLAVEAGVSDALSADRNRAAPDRGRRDS